MRVITYGTFDLFHEGHKRLLERARTLGDYLVVGVTTDNYDASRGKLNVHQTLMERVANVRESGFADEVIIEEYEGQKIQDVQELDIDIFAIGSDWLGEFDYLDDYCRVVYLDRTKGVSSTLIRGQLSGVMGMGVVGTGRIAQRFAAEARFVSGVSIEAVFARRREAAAEYAERFEVAVSCDTYEDLLSRVDAVYIATPHDTHFQFALRAIEAGVHVLCEKPLALGRREAETLFGAAEAHQVVLMEALKTAFSPGFQRMVAVARSGSIGSIRSVDATFTKLVDLGRELQGPSGGSITELASYPLLAIFKLLGSDYVDMSVHSLVKPGEEVDTFSRIDLLYPQAVASARTGLGVKAEGDLVVAGERGYLYVPAPWWLTEYFELRFEDPARNKKFYYKFDGDGLRYELAEFVRLIRESKMESHKLRSTDSIALATAIERARSSATVFGQQTEEKHKWVAK